jgi:hypothetical protein
MMRKARLAIRKVNAELDGTTLLLDANRNVICSLCVFSLAKEDQVNDNAQRHHGHDYHLLQVFRIKGPRGNCPRCGSTMTALMIDDGKRVAAGGARLQWHMIPIADIDLIARNTEGKKMGSRLKGRVAQIAAWQIK